MNILQTPSRLIERHGRDVLYTPEGVGTYDPSTSSYTVSNEATETVKAYKTQTSFRDSQQPNLINRDSATYLISAQDISVKPKMQDNITDGSDEYEVVVVQEITARGVSAMYKVIVVRA